MKYIGLMLVIIGVTLLLFVFYNFLKDRNRLASPIPEEKGIKVIFVTPTK